MSKDETIQDLRERLARAEGERDAWKEAAKAHPLPFVPPVQPFATSPLRYCANCGAWYVDSHCCMYAQPWWYVPYNPGPYTVWSTTTSTVGASTNTLQIAGSVT